MDPQMSLKEDKGLPQKSEKNIVLYIFYEQSIRDNHVPYTWELDSVNFFCRNIQLPYIRKMNAILVIYYCCITQYCISEIHICIISLFGGVKIPVMDTLRLLIFCFFGLLLKSVDSVSNLSAHFVELQL